MYLRFIYRLFVLFGFLIANIISVSAQSDMHGTEFWCAFMNNEMGKVTGRLYFTSVYDAEVDIENRGRNFFKTVSVKANVLNYIDIPDSVARPTKLEEKEKSGFYIHSDKPVLITCVLFEVHASNAFVLIPLKRVSTKEKFITAHGMPKSKNQILVLAAEDSVVFKINLLAPSTGKHKANVPFTLVLNKGETYSIVADSGDFSGSVVEIMNQKKGLVYIGDKNISIDYGGCEHRSVYNQLNSIDWSDRRFVVIPLFGQTKGYKIKCISLDSHLFVNVNGYSHFIVNKDSSIEIDINNGDSVLLVTADRPFLCFQIMKGGGQNGFYKHASGGHPGIVQLAGASHLTNESHFVSLTDTKINDHFASILIDKRSRDNVYLDQIQLPPEDFLPVPDDTNFLYVNRMVNPGAHVLRSSHGHQVYAYGVEVSSVAESYFYFAGFKYPIIKSALVDSVISFDCRNQRIFGRIKTDINNPYNLKIKQIIWKSDSFSISSNVTFFDTSFVAGSTYNFTVFVHFESHIDTIREQFTFKFPEFNPVFDFVSCNDSIVFKISNPYFTNIKWHDSSAVRLYVAKRPEDIFVTARDTSGYCVFSDSAQIREVQFDRRLFTDTLSDCHVNNLFRIKDESRALNDSIRLRVWNYKGEVIAYDTNLIEYHFDQPGKPVIQLDLYLQESQKKCRLDIPFRVHWNTYTRADFGGERFCTGDTVTVIDKSFPCCDSVVLYSVYSDGIAESSNGKKLRFPVTFNPIPGTGFMTFYYVVTNDKGCRDTMKKEIIVMPKAEAMITQTDSIEKCISMARWNFTHKRDESLTGPYEIKWFLGDSLIGSNDEYRNFRIRTKGMHSMKLITKTSFGCIDSSQKGVEVLPEPEVNIQSDSAFNCLNIPKMEFKAKSEFPSSLTYLWKLNGQPVSTDSIVSIHHNFDSLFNLSLLASSANIHCPSALAERWIQFNQKPTAAFAMSDTLLCVETGSLKLTNQSKLNRPLDHIYWQWGTNSDSLVEFLECRFPVSGEYSIRLKIIDTLGCSDSAVKFIEVRDPVPVKIKTDREVICENEGLEISADHPASEKLWYVNDERMAETGSILALKSIEAGKYHIKVKCISEIGCISSDSTDIVAGLKPIAGFNSSSDTLCFPDYEFDLINTSVAYDEIIRANFYYSSDSLLGTDWNLKVKSGLKKGENRIIQTVITESGCMDTFFRDVYLLEFLSPGIVGDTICEGDFAHVYPSKELPPQTSYILWNTGDGNQVESESLVYRYPQSGEYSPVLEVYSTEGCRVTDTLDNGVIVFPKPVASFYHRVLISNDFSELQLWVDSGSRDLNKWWIGSFGEREGYNVKIPVEKGFTQWVSMKQTNRFGCSDSVAEFVEVYPKMQWLIPSAFSPNEDGLNDRFGLNKIDGVHDYNLRIYNRWGELIFESSDINISWDGKYKGEDVQVGIYFYTLQFVYGKKSNLFYNGIVQLLR